MNNFTEENQQKGLYKDQKTQQMLNTPLNEAGVSRKNKEFLDMLMNLIKNGKIDLFKPDTLINHDVYDKLTEEKQGKVDIEAVNLLSAIREIKGLYDAGYQDTYQMENLVERIRNTKERLEEEGGDLFII